MNKYFLRFRFAFAGIPLTSSRRAFSLRACGGGAVAREGKENKEMRPRSCARPDAGGRLRRSIRMDSRYIAPGRNCCLPVCLFFDTVNGGRMRETNKLPEIQIPPKLVSGEIPRTISGHDHLAAVTHQPISIEMPVVR